MLDDVILLHCLVLVDNVDGVNLHDRDVGYKDASFNFSGDVS